MNYPPLFVAFFPLFIQVEKGKIKSLRNQGILIHNLTDNRERRSPDFQALKCPLMLPNSADLVLFCKFAQKFKVSPSPLS